jgi:AcrR family transcriptional regulator
MSSAVRLSAAERRQAIIDAAVRVFAEPILYRHFASKRDLYLAAVEHVWQQVRARWDEIVEGEADPRRLLEKMAHSKASVTSSKFALAELWVQALSEAGEEPELRKYLRGHLREVHEYLAAGVRRAQELGAIDPARDADAEAWIFLAGGVLSTISRRIGLLQEGDLERIRASRLAWLTGEPAKD